MVFETLFTDSYCFPQRRCYAAAAARRSESLSEPLATRKPVTPAVFSAQDVQVIEVC